MILLGVYALFSAARASGAQRPFVIAVALGLLAVGVGGLRFFGSDARVTLPRIGGIVLGLVGTLFAVWQFWYQNQFVPARAGRAVALKATLSLDGRQKTSDVVRARLDFEGAGKTSVVVIGSAYTLTGSRVVRCRRPSPAEAVKDVYRGFLVDPQRSRYMTQEWEEQPPGAARDREVRRRREAPGPGRGVEPRPRLPRPARPLSAAPPAGAAVRDPGVRGTLSRSLPTYDFLDDNALYGFWHVEDDSWLHDLLYGRERWVVLRYDLVNRFPGRPPPKQTSPADPRLRALPRPRRGCWGSRTRTRRSACSRRPRRATPASRSRTRSSAVGDLVQRTPQDTAPKSCR